MSVVSLREAAQQSPTPVVEWDWFYQYFQRNFRQGEHVTMVGPTGDGKTTLIQRVARLRGYVIIFGVKSQDESMDKLIKAGYKRINSWEGGAEKGTHLILWPKITGEEDVVRQYHTFHSAVNKAIAEGAWTLVFDEVSYMSDMLRMERQLKWALQQGRSSHNSVIAATQRPAFIPLAFYDQATHLFLWSDVDDVNRKRAATLAGNAKGIVYGEIAELDKYEFLYINRNTRERFRSKVKIGG